MKPIAGLGALLMRAKNLGVMGNRARSVVKAANPSGIAAVVAQQFALADWIASAGLLAILEPAYDIGPADRAEGEPILLAELLKGLSSLSFSRVLLSDLCVSDDEFDAALGAAIDEIYRASA